MSFYLTVVLISRYMVNLIERMTAYLTHLKTTSPTWVLFLNCLCKLFWSVFSEIMNTAYNLKEYFVFTSCHFLISSMLPVIASWNASWINLQFTVNKLLTKWLLQYRFCSELITHNGQHEHLKRKVLKISFINIF